MKKIKFLLPLIAVVFAVAGVFAMKANKTTVSNLPPTQAYFQFIGSHGQESNRAQWIAISEEQYETLDCDGDQKGCRLVGDLNTVDNHPVEVYVTSATAQVPTIGQHVSAVNNAPMD